MRRVLALLAISAGLTCSGPVSSADALPPAPAPDPAVAAMVSEVSAARLQATDARLAAFGTRNTFATEPNPARGVLAARDWIAGQFRAVARQSGGRMTVALDSYVQPKTPQTPRAVLVSSVIATLRGDDPSGRTYVISSHYDSRNSDGNDAVKDAPGADDNASAVAAVLEAARIMAGRRFAGTILFAAYDAEEQGLWGSQHHAETLRANAIPVEADLNSDIIGASRGHDGVAYPDRVRVYAPALPEHYAPTDATLYGLAEDSPDRELARFAKENVERYVPGFFVELIGRADRFGRGGDQESFQASGFAAIRFTEASEDYDHQHQDVRVENGHQFGDLIAFEDFDYLARVTRGLVATLAELALGPGRPAHAAAPIGRTLSYAPVLQWDPVPGAASYEVVWRKPAETGWTAARNVGNVTSFEPAGYNRDRYAFGVRAIDAQGRHSLVSYCQPR